MNMTKYPDRKAMERFTSDLKLANIDQFTQDWEVEASDKERIEEFLNYYQNNNLNENEKFTLMLLILTSWDEAISEGKVDVNLCDMIEKILLNDYEIHKQTIEYWACDDVDIEDGFAITPYIREINARKISGDE